MPRTIGSALDELEAGLFVGREREMELFASWLVSGAAKPVLNVVARGGMGKSTLLGAFRRHAVQEGRAVVSLDAEGLDATASGFLQSLIPGTDDPIAYCNDHSCVVLIDAFGKVAWLTRFLQDEFLPNLRSDVKVVIAGRFPLGAAWTRWHALIDAIHLEPLTADHARDYLWRRGLTETPVVDQIVRATGGLPLALALAADLVTKLGAHDLTALSEWRLVVRSLVSKLVHDVADEELVRLIEACSIVRHFDEPTLAVMTGMDDATEAFARLCGLSVVRAGEHGLSLHDDVRSVVTEDLRWRNPERYRALHDKASSYLRDRMAKATRDERHWLWAERMFLWEDEFVRSVLFGPSRARDIGVALGGPSNAAEAIDLERRWHDQILPTSSRVEWSVDYPQEGVLSWLRRAMEMPASRLALARDVHGALTGYSLVMPLYRGSLPLLRAEETLSALVRSHWNDAELARLPVEGADADAFVIVRTCVADSEPSATNAALFRDLLGLLALEGTYVVYAAFPERRALYESLGFKPVRTTEVYHWIADYPFQAYVLDLKRIGFESWIEALMAGRAPARRPTADELETELSELLPRWDDVAAIGRSSLAGIAGDAEGVRALVQSALEELRDDHDLTLALRAVQLAYIDRAASHERIAERLAVSRSTFYRLLKRGVRAIAEAVGRPV
ncbi:MAG: hypothetical protein WD826_07400 [Actinomycetota bacterium]